MAFYGSNPNTARLVGLLGLRTQLSTCQQAFPSGVRKDRQHNLRGEESLLGLQRRIPLSVVISSNVLLDLHHR